MNTPVTFENAKLLKEKGFDEECFHYYDLEYKELATHVEDTWKNSEIENGYPKGVFVKLGKCPMISAPTIAEVIMWLYKEHKIWIACNLDLSSTQLFDYRIQKFHYLKLSEENYDSQTEAYSKAIECTLTKLI